MRLEHLGGLSPLGFMASSNGTGPPSGAENSLGTALVIPRLWQRDDAKPPFDGRGVGSLGRYVQKASFA